MGVSNHTYKVGDIHGCQEILDVQINSKTTKITVTVKCIHCGTIKIMPRAHYLFDERYSSCMCKNRTIGGDHSSRLYHTYANMKYRCENPNCAAFFRYGAKGIKVCNEWNGEGGYLAFKEWSLAHGYNDNMTIDRIDNCGDYSPDNCQWVTRSENTARANATCQHRHANKGTYYGIDPDGKQYIFENASQFSREHPELKADKIRNVANGMPKCKTHKGWKFGFVKDLCKQPQSTIETVA